MSDSEHKKRVMDALNRFYGRPNCPECGLRYWNGMLHAYKGVYKSNKSEQEWCNGKYHFKAGQKKEDE